MKKDFLFDFYPHINYDVLFYFLKEIQMFLSATGSWLPGPCPLHNPEVKLNVSVTHNTPGNFSKNSTGKPSPFYILGCIPLVSTVSGLSQALLGTVHAIIHLVNAIFRDNWTHHLKEAGLGLKHVVLGTIAAFPIIGNIFMIVFSVIKIARLQKEVDKRIEEKGQIYQVGDYQFTKGDYPIGKQFVDSGLLVRGI